MFLPLCVDSFYTKLHLWGQFVIVWTFCSPYKGKPHLWSRFRTKILIKFRLNIAVQKGQAVEINTSEPRPISSCMIKPKDPWWHPVSVSSYGLMEVSAGPHKDRNTSICVSVCGLEVNPIKKINKNAALVVSHQPIQKFLELNWFYKYWTKIWQSCKLTK